MKPVVGTTPYGVHKDLTGAMVDDPAIVAAAYEFVRFSADVFLATRPELEVVEDTVVDVVFTMPDGSAVQRVEWQALMKEKTDAQG